MKLKDIFTSMQIMYVTKYTKLAQNFQAMVSPITTAELPYSDRKLSLWMLLDDTS